MKNLKIYKQDSIITSLEAIIYLLYKIIID